MLDDGEKEPVFTRTIRQWSKSPFLVWVLLLFYLFFYYFFAIFGSLALGVIDGSTFVDILCAAFSIVILTNFTSLGCNIFNSRGYVFKNKKQKEIALALLVITFICLYIVGQVFGTLIYNAGDASFASYRKESQAPYYVTFVLSVIVAPICEELMYRGAVYYTFKRAFPTIVAIVIQALVFSLMHGTKVHLPGTFVLAIFNALLLELTGKFRYNIASHAIYNLIATLPNGMFYPKFLFNWWLIIVLYVVILGMFFYYYVHLKKMTEKPVKAPKTILDKLHI